MVRGLCRVHMRNISRASQAHIHLKRCKRMNTMVSCIFTFLFLILISPRPFLPSKIRNPLQYTHTHTHTHTLSLSLSFGTWVSGSSAMRHVGRQAGPTSLSVQSPWARRWQSTQCTLRFWMRENLVWQKLKETQLGGADGDKKKVKERSSREWVKS